MENRQVYISIEDRKTADELLLVYSPYVYQGTLENNLGESKKLKANTNACRFCNKDRSVTKFTQNTHLISKLLGNNGYYSHDECDECNQLFRLRENDLAIYMGTSRTFDHIRTDKAAHAFESASGQVGVKKLGGESFIIYRKKEGQDFDVDIKEGTARINLDSKFYRPDFVYLWLLKMALAILPKEDIAAYEVAFKFLQIPENYPEFDYLKRVCVTETGMTIARPFVQLFQKLPAIRDAAFPENVFYLSVGRFMFQIMLPGHVLDKNQICKNFSFQVAPYIQLNTVDAHDHIIERRYVENLWTS